MQLYEIWDYLGGEDVTQYSAPMYRRSPKWLWQLSDFASPGGTFMRFSEKFMLVFKITNLIWWRWGFGHLEACHDR